MKTINVGSATKGQLDWLVCRCQGATDIRREGDFWVVSDPINGDEYLGNLSYSTDPGLMHPIIRREHITVMWRTASIGWWACISEYPEDEETMGCFDDEPLRAAAKVYVLDRLGEEVEVPEELE